MGPPNQHLKLSARGDRRPQRTRNPLGGYERMITCQRCGRNQAWSVERFRSVECLYGQPSGCGQARGRRRVPIGRFHAPQRPALIFMMSPAQLPASPDGTSVGKFLSHTIVFYPQIHNADGLLESEDNSVPAVLETDRRCQP
jgi:hypothetical protein